MVDGLRVAAETVWIRTDRHGAPQQVALDRPSIVQWTRSATPPRLTPCGRMAAVATGAVVSSPVRAAVDLAPDPVLPRRDDLLDDRVVGVRLGALLDRAWGGGTAGDCTRVRARYRLGESLRATYRVGPDGGHRLVSARMFPTSQGRHPVPARSRRRGRAGRRRAVGAVRRGAQHRLLGLPAGPQARRSRPADRPASRASRHLRSPWTHSELMAYTPEKAATVRCMDSRGATVGFAKLQGADDGPRSVATLRAARGIPEHGILRLPDAVGYLPEQHLALFSPAPGRPLHQLDRSAVPEAMTALGAALSVLHAQPTDGFEPFTRLDPDQVAAAGHLVCAARPDLSPLAEALVGVLLLTAPAPGPGVLLHGDLHPKNVLVHDSGVGLVDLDQAGVGPAGAELGGMLARLWCPRPGTRSTPTRPRPPARPCSRRTTVRRLSDDLLWYAATALLVERAARAIKRLDLPDQRPGGGPGDRPGLGPTADDGGPMTRPRLLFYCQHSVGLGHLVRSVHLAEGLARDFDVTLLNGGPWPVDLPEPSAIDIVHLPALGLDEDYTLISRDERFTVDEAVGLRRSMIQRCFRDTAPDVLLIELFPFGRKKFRGELMPLLEAARAAARPRSSPAACATSSSAAGATSRARRSGQPGRQRVLRRRPRACGRRFATLEETFHPNVPLRVPVHYTGFVRAPVRRDGERPRERRVLVSAGGGLVGAPLFRAAVDAHPRLLADHGLRTVIVTGPFLPDPDVEELTRRAAETTGLEVVRYLPDLGGEMAASAVTVSQAGYNTTMDILGCTTPAVVVPYGEGREDEQAARAHRLAGLGALRVLDSDRLGAHFAEAVGDASRTGPAARPARARRAHPHVGAAADPDAGRGGDAMTGWLDPLRAALDARSAPVWFFFRDDDAGWDDPALEALLDVFEPHGLRWTWPRSRWRRRPGPWSSSPAGRTAVATTSGSTSSGLAHVNHEPEGRKCEFGVSRPPEQQREDIAHGRDVLRGLFGDLPSVFTPPWNRCAPWTAEVLHDLGFTALSRDLPWARPASPVCWSCRSPSTGSRSAEGAGRPGRPG